MTDEEIALAFMSPSPSMLFTFKRRNADGSVTEWPVRIRMPRLEERLKAVERAQAFAKSRGEDSKRYEDIYREAQAIEMVALVMCRDDERTRRDGTKYWAPFFTGAEQVRLALTEPEMAAILNMLTIVETEFGNMDSFSVADVDRWITRLAKPLEGPLFLSELDSSDWPALLIAMAQRVQSQFQTHGLTLYDWPSSSESDQPNSTPDTTSSSEPPSVFTPDGVEVELPDGIDRK